jgi:hypothetical protein
LHVLEKLEKRIEFWSKNLRRGDHLGDLGVDGRRIQLKRILDEMSVNMRLD